MSRIKAKKITKNDRTIAIVGTEETLESIDDNSIKIGLHEFLRRMGYVPSGELHASKENEKLDSAITKSQPSKKSNRL